MFSRLPEARNVFPVKFPTCSTCLSVFWLRLPVFSLKNGPGLLIRLHIATLSLWGNKVFKKRSSTKPQMVLKQVENVWKPTRTLYLATGSSLSKFRAILLQSCCLSWNCRAYAYNFCVQF